VLGNRGLRRGHLDVRGARRQVLRRGLRLQLRRGRHLWYRRLSATEAVFGGRQRRVPRLPASLHRRQQLRLWLDVHQRRALPAAQLRWGRHVPVGFHLWREQHLHAAELHLGRRVHRRLREGAVLRSSRPMRALTRLIADRSPPKRCELMHGS
jgi:hypothetical protein